MKSDLKEEFVIEGSCGGRNHNIRRRAVVQWLKRTARESVGTKLAKSHM